MERKKKLFWALLSLLLAALSVWAVLAQSGDLTLAELWDSLRDANRPWLLAAVVCGGMFILLEGAALCCILRGLGYRQRLDRGFLYSASDIYFSAITPSASGGQPASAFFMVKDGVPAGAVTVALLVNLIMYTTSIMILGLGAVALDFRLLAGFRWASRLLIAMGFLCLGGLTVLFWTMLRRGHAVFAALERLLDWLHRRGFVRDPSRARDRLCRTREEFAECAAMIRGKGTALRRAFVYNLGQRASQIAVPMCLHMAMGGKMTMAGLVFSAQCLVTIGYNCVPVPGGMGVADLLMLDGFSALMDRDAAFRLELLSRGLSFYLCAAVGGAVTLLGYVLLKKRERKQKRHDRRL